MKIEYLLDTNILAEPLKPRPNSGIMEHLEKHERALAIPSVVWHEMEYGTYRLPQGPKRRALESYLETVIRPTIPILPYDVLAAEVHALERARLEAAGRTPPFVDGQIAAIAITNKLALVTVNTRDFSSFEGLRLENWQS